ncbi:hypothetical protein ABPG74_015930 [Tetrahymena malaccensis]
MIKILNRFVRIQKFNNNYLKNINNNQNFYSIHQKYLNHFSRKMAESKLYLTKDETCEYLKSINLEFKRYDHEPCFNVEDMQKYLKLEKAPLIKNLFYQDKKGNYYLVVAKHDTKVEKTLWKQVNLAPGNMRLAADEKLEAVLKVKRGHVNPFALVNDTDKLVKALIIDEHLKNEEYWAFHPMDNSACVEFKQSEFQKFVDAIGRTFVHVRLDLSEEEEKKLAEQSKKETAKVEEAGHTKLGIDVKKDQDLSEWYKQVITKSELIEYYDISGCYILRPHAYAIWEIIQRFFDDIIKGFDVQNAYFPMFVTDKALNKEKEHVEGFSPEVAWVTRSGSTDLPEPIAVRPTSETIMYPAYSKWIKSHRDLPLKLNQWTNVVRWEFKDPTPFIRTREFLWQEGHTAHATDAEATEFTYLIQDQYRRVYEELLAVPVIKGIKSENEKFPGAYFSSTIETCIPSNGRAVQAATSHHLGQNFSKMFDISFLDGDKKKQFAYQTSWGLTTRTIGVMILYHGDDKGLVLPPLVASTQVVIVPIIKTGADNERVLKKAHDLKAELKKAGIRVQVDDRDNYTSGWKFNHWEVKGIPLRFEIGQMDMDKNQVTAVWRVNSHKEAIPNESVIETTKLRLKEIQDLMLTNSKKKFNEKIKPAGTWPEFMTSLNSRCIVYTPWCNEIACEKAVKERSALESKGTENESGLSGSAKTLCIPNEQEPIAEGTKCFSCGKPALKRVYWGRSY